jgi:hypothetical protein
MLLRAYPAPMVSATEYWKIEKGIKLSPTNTVIPAQAGWRPGVAGRCQGGLAAGSISIFGVLK